MELEFTNRLPDPEQYNTLRLRSGMGGRKSDQRVIRALEGSSFVCSVWDGERLIGLGRVIDDGGICFSVNDIMVDKEYQRRGIADRIMTEIDHYLDAHADEECFVTLIAKIPADHIYLRHRFEYIDPDRRYGMIRHQDDRPAKKYSPI
ncbi:MAG: GNAT family N-acetyltransferase [Solobacterium sp.]|nr:GNAT family N-acetyltransferase [Solobacterium sp.]